MELSNLQDFFEKTAFPNRKNEAWRFSDFNFWNVENLRKYAALTPKDNACKCKPRELLNGFDTTSFDAVLRINCGDISFEKSADFFKVENLESAGCAKFYEYPQGLGAFGELSCKVSKDCANLIKISLNANASGKICIISECAHSGLQGFGMLVDALENSNFELYFLDAVCDDTFYFKNVFCNLHEGASLNFSSLNLSKADSPRYETYRAVLAQNAKFIHTHIESGFAHTRNETFIELAGEGAAADFRVLLNCRHNARHDLKTSQVHSSKGASSNLEVRAILSEDAEADFIGSISVCKEAQQTQAYQSCKALQLSENSRLQSLPILEIEANDVNCSHGCAVAGPNEDELFYMRSRGLDSESSRTILVGGFARGILEQIHEENFVSFALDSLSI